MADTARAVIWRLTCMAQVPSGSPGAGRWPGGATTQPLRSDSGACQIFTPELKVSEPGLREVWCEVSGKVLPRPETLGNAAPFHRRRCDGESLHIATAAQPSLVRTTPAVLALFKRRELAAVKAVQKVFNRIR